MFGFIVKDSLPYLYAGGETFSVRLTEDGYEVGSKVELDVSGLEVFSEIAIKAQACKKSSIALKKPKAKAT